MTNCPCNSLTMTMCFFSAIVPSRQQQKQQPAEASRNILSSKILPGSERLWLNGWKDSASWMQNLYSKIFIRTPTVCLPAYTRASWKSSPASFVKRSSSSNTPWSFTCALTPRRNPSSARTVSMPQLSKVRVNEGRWCRLWFFAAIGIGSRLFFLSFFFFKGNLNVHLRKHTGEKFNCQHCPYSCLSPGHLKVLSFIYSFLHWELMLWRVCVRAQILSVLGMQIID